MVVRVVVEVLELEVRPGQADRVVEFIRPDSELAKRIDKEYWVKKEVERRKFRPKHVVSMVQEAGFMRFRIQPEHVKMWQSEDAKNPAKGFGVDVLMLRELGIGIKLGLIAASNSVRLRETGTSSPAASKPTPQFFLPASLHQSPKNFRSFR